MSTYLEQHPNKNYPQFGSTRRNGGKVTGTIVLHDAENITDLEGPDFGAENVAKFIANRQSYGSYHMLVDRDSIIYMLPWTYEAWHCIYTNNWSVGISVAWRKSDLGSMGKDNRQAYYRMLAEATLIAVRWFADRGITVPINRFLTRNEALARKPGITTHSRTDPSRRSDPFGTGSKYEDEFLAVLAEVAGEPLPDDNDDYLPTQGGEDTIMTKLPTLDWRKESTNYSLKTKRVQALLKVAGYYRDDLDGLRGPNSRKALAAFQKAKNTGDGKGGPDYFVGPATWAALLGV